MFLLRLLGSILIAPFYLADEIDSQISVTCEKTECPCPSCLSRCDGHSIIVVLISNMTNPRYPLRSETVENNGPQTLIRIYVHVALSAFLNGEKNTRILQ